MCGFAGELRVGELADVEAVARMAATMDDRGPDGSGTWASGPLALSFRRLKIIDLSEHGSLPMTDPEFDLTISFNGCIYNSSDTEVLLKGYHCWGERLVDRIKGMFAFCIAERDTGRVILGRNRLDIKPLYLSDSGGVLRFASTLPALLVRPVVGEYTRLGQARITVEWLEDDEPSEEASPT